MLSWPNDSVVGRAVAQSMKIRVWMEFSILYQLTFSGSIPLTQKVS